MQTKTPTPTTIHRHAQRITAAQIRDGETLMLIYPGEQPVPVVARGAGTESKLETDMGILCPVSLIRGGIYRTH